MKRKNTKMSKLYVNIDHVATLRNQRGTFYPDPISIAKICEENGAEGITVHLREDRRHIKDADVLALRKEIKTVLNLEMACTNEMIAIAKRIKPEISCIVPEKREELTTEGGLDVKKGFEKIKALVEELQSSDILVSLFIEPDYEQIEFAKKTGARYVELHTGTYANATKENERKMELERILKAVAYVNKIGLTCNLGHGLDYSNVIPLVKQATNVSEYNIGHSIICRAVAVGMAQAVKEMNDLIKGNL